MIPLVPKRKSRWFSAIRKRLYWLVLVAFGHNNACDRADGAV